MKDKTENRLIYFSCLTAFARISIRVLHSSDSKLFPNTMRMLQNFSGTILEWYFLENVGGSEAGNVKDLIYKEIKIKIRTQMEE